MPPGAAEVFFRSKGELAPDKQGEESSSCTADEPFLVDWIFLRISAPPILLNFASSAFCKLELAPRPSTVN